MYNIIMYDMNIPDSNVSVVASMLLANQA